MRLKDSHISGLARAARQVFDQIVDEDTELAWAEYEASLEAKRKVEIKEAEVEDIAWDWCYSQDEEAEIEDATWDWYHRVEAETQAVWDDYNEQQELEAQQAYDNERCPCGHLHREHYFDVGYCKVKRCGCQEFGEPVENWEEQPTKVYLGDPGDEMGSISYE